MSWWGTFYRLRYVILVLVGAATSIIVSLRMNSLVPQLIWWFIGVTLLVVLHFLQKRTAAQMTEELLPDNPERFVKPAAEALIAVIEGRVQDSATIIEGIAEKYGSVGIQGAMIAWCDLYREHATAGVPGAAGLQLTVSCSDPDTAVPPELAWTQRMINARVEMDRQGWSAALNDLPDDVPGVSQYVMTLVHTVALSLKTLPRGYAWTGPEEEST